MSWLRIDDGFVEHERIDPLTDRSFRLHVAALCHCARNLTDGYVSDKNVKVLRVRANNATAKHVAELVDAGVWVPVEDGYVIRDYLDYNPPADKVREERRRAAERMRSVRANVRANVPENVQANVRGPRPVPFNNTPSFLPTSTTDGKEGRSYTPPDNLLKEVDAA